MIGLIMYIDTHKSCPHRALSSPGMGFLTEFNVQYSVESPPPFYTYPAGPHCITLKWQKVQITDGARTLHHPEASAIYPAANLPLLPGTG
jgi:hypothetical protein